MYSTTNPYFHSTGTGTRRLAIRAPEQPGRPGVRAGATPARLHPGGCHTRPICPSTCDTKGARGATVAKGAKSAQTPEMATTPSTVPRNPLPPDTDIDAKCGSETPSGTDPRTAPDEGSSSYSVPLATSGTHT